MNSELAWILGGIGAAFAVLIVFGPQAFSVLCDVLGAIAEIFED